MADSRNLNYRRLVVHDALSKLKGGAPLKNSASSDISAMLAKLERAITEVTTLITPILHAGGAIKQEDRDKSLRPMILAELMKRFDSSWFDKDELVQIISILIGDRIMSDVEADPWGGGTPDLLGGK